MPVKKSVCVFKSHSIDNGDIIELSKANVENNTLFYLKKNHKHTHCL